MMNCENRNKTFQIFNKKPETRTQNIRAVCV